MIVKSHLHFIVAESNCLWRVSNSFGESSSWYIQNIFTLSVVVFFSPVLHLHTSIFGPSSISELKTEEKKKSSRLNTFNMQFNNNKNEMSQVSVSSYLLFLFSCMPLDYLIRKRNIVFFASSETAMQDNNEENEGEEEEQLIIYYCFGPQKIISKCFYFCNDMSSERLWN